MKTDNLQQVATLLIQHQLHTRVVTRPIDRKVAFAQWYGSSAATAIALGLNIADVRQAVLDTLNHNESNGTWQERLANDLASRLERKTGDRA